MLKRLFDISVSLLAIILSSPLLLLISVLILLTDGRPIFYNQERLGKDATVFKFYKFRSMTVNPKRRVNQQVREFDPEVTSIGRKMRRLKIDELPQLFNILKGEMSIVGPRPTLVSYLESYTPQQRQRLDVLGGLTCLAQVNGGSYLSWDERIEYDLIYIETQGMWLDIKIIIKTIVVIFLGENRFIKRPKIERSGKDLKRF